MVTTETAPTPTSNGTVWHVLSREAATRELHVDPDRGLTSGEAAERLARYGPNRFAEAKAESRWHAFLRQYQDPMQIVLLAAGLISIYPVKQAGTGIVILLLTLLNAALGLSQEGKAAAAVAALAKMMIVKARVRRDGALALLPAEQLVPGDIVAVEAGDVVPADGRVLSAATMEIAEAALTGESLPVGKGVEPVAAADAPLGDRTDMVYMNTNVTRGTGEFVVTATGMATEVGHISGMLQAQDESKSPLTQQLEKLTKQLVTIAALALVASVVLNMARGQSFTEVFTVAVAFAIAAIPTGLPAVVTTILSRGTRLLADANAIVKRLRSTETLGATSAICSDKTGTLTLNQMTAVELTIPGRRYTVSGSGYSTEGHVKHAAGEPEVPLEPFMFPLALACDAVVTDAGEMIGDPTEGALVVLAEKGGVDVIATRKRYPRVAALPFDTAYKLMATFHRMADESGREVIRCFVKGAPDQLLARASSHLDPSLRPAAADAGFTQRYLDENERLAAQGLRVMATARRDFDPATFDAGGDMLALMQELTLMALVGIVDPPRPAAKTAIATAHAAGIQVRMITGDHAVTAAAIAATLGIEGRAITGAQFAELTDDQADREIDEIGVIARVTPEQKVRLVDILKRKGHVVGMTGDGVNDAPALKQSDIGIAMGITGTEVSKEAAAMILTDDNFATIVKAVELGRGLYDNLVKYIRFQMGVLAGMIVTFLGASILNIASGIPFLPLQTLWVNFTTQVFQAVGLGYGAPGEGLMERRPRKPEQPILNRADTRWFIVAGLVMAIATLAVVAGAEDAEGEALARTMGLTTFSLANLFFSFTARDALRSVFSLDTFNDRTFIVTSLLSAGAILFATESGFFQRILDTVELTGDQWLICIGAAAAILVVSEAWKFALRRRERAATRGARVMSGSADVRDRILDRLVVVPGEAAGIADRDPGWTGGHDFAGLAMDELEERANDAVRRGIEELSDAQELLWASDRYAVLVVLQAMDAAGKDSAIEHVMKGVNPQGVQVVSFKQPSSEELDHDYLWRISKALPERGRIGIFNRSHYEEVVALKVHPEWLEPQRLPPGERDERFWQARYEDINAFERHLERNGTAIVKLFLHVSKEVQKKRFIARLDTPGREWKFNAADVAERALWDSYMGAFEDALTATSTPWAPWYVIPADHKALTQALVAAVLVQKLKALDVRWPEVSAADHAANLRARAELEAEPAAG